MKPGEWKSPLKASDIAEGGVSAAWPAFVGDDIWWLETRPAEGGRRVIVSKKFGDLIDAPFSASHQVHEYGGRSYLGISISDGYLIYFVNKSDQRIYKKVNNDKPFPITPESESSYRYAEMIKVGDEIWCVREHVTQSSCTREIVAISDNGSIRTLVSGHQFYAHLRISPNGKHLSWISWEHPRMPWDGTELFIADVANGELTNKRVSAGNQNNPVLSPEWLDDSTIVYLDEETGWWNPWTVTTNGSRKQIVKEDSEWGFPAWQLGYSAIAILNDGRFVGIHGALDDRKLVVVDPKDGAVENIPSQFNTFIPTIVSNGKSVLAFAANNSNFSTLLKINIANKLDEQIVRPNPLPLPATFAPEIKEITVAGNGREIKVILHRAKNPDYSASGATPLLIQVHGGPTAHNYASIDREYLYWTSRGFTIADINYGGSTGYGSKYRHLLDGQWGVIDYEDVISTVNYLVNAGIAEKGKIFIAGGSAGGFTVLNALVHSDVFAAGADYYGVAELSMLATDTHDFESRYLDSMIGPYPERKDLYLERSPLTHAEKLSTPLIIFQGTDDKVVPPSQSEAFRDVCIKKGITYKYFAFEGEGHGFVKSESIITSLEESLLFFGKAGGFTPSV